ncbi:hypothetical protein D3C87_1573030 [compost metagenome]
MKIGGLTKPIIVRKTGISSFNLIHNPLGYFASVRAKELDPLAGEMVLAFVAESDEQQLALLDMARLLDER